MDETPQNIEYQTNAQEYEESLQHENDEIVHHHLCTGDSKGFVDDGAYLSTGAGMTVSKSSSSISRNSGYRFYRLVEIERGTYRAKEESAGISALSGRPRFRIVHDQMRKAIKAMRERISNAKRA